MHVLLAAALLLAAPSEAPKATTILPAETTIDDSTWTLRGGVSYPKMALNTADLSPELIVRTIKLGVSLGLRNVDFHLGDERKGVAAALKAGVSRDDLFLVTKLDKPPSDMLDPEEAAKLARDTLEDELTQLGTDVDMLLLKDSTSCPVMLAQWAVLEEYLAAKRVKALGTYNYCEFSLDCLLGNATVPPSINYLMRHVGMGPDATGIIAYGEARGVKMAAYGSLGEPIALPELLTDPTLRSVADKYGRSVESVALRWNVQAGHAVSNRLSADYAPDNLPDGQAYCEASCAPALTAMSEVYDWSLEPEVRGRPAAPARRALDLACVGLAQLSRVAHSCPLRGRGAPRRMSRSSTTSRSSTLTTSSRPRTTRRPLAPTRLA